MEILTYIQTYGLSVAVIAFAIINIIGLLKLLKIYDKITNVNVRKLVFLITDLALAFGGSAIYFAIFGVPFTQYFAVYSGVVFNCVLAIYAVYEQVGLRALWRKVIAAIINCIKNHPEHSLAKAAKKYGLDSAVEVVEKLIVEKQEEDAKKAEQERIKAEEKAKAEAEKKAIENAKLAAQEAIKRIEQGDAGKIIF